MEIPDQLDAADALAIVKLFSDVLHHGNDPLLQKRMILDGVAEMVDADYWVWAKGIFNASTKNGKILSLDYGNRIGLSEQQMLDLNAGNYEGDAVKIMDMILNGKHHGTRTRRDIVKYGFLWHMSPIYRKHRKPLGLDDFLISLYRPQEGIISGVGFHRAKGQQPFTGRDRFVVHTVVGGCDWLHKHSTDFPVEDDVALTRNERRVLTQLLTGDAYERIGQSLEMKPSTVTDYAKKVRQRYGFKSRAELQAYFASGGKFPNN